MQGVDGGSSNAGLESLISVLGSMQGEDRIRRAVDFGCGAGKIGRFLRSNLPLFLLEGVDVWEPTVTRRSEETPPVYHIVTRQDFAEVFEGGEEGVLYEKYLKHWLLADLWFFGDCLEHIDRETAFKIMNYPGGPRFIAVRIPVGEWEQGPVHENEAECHRWSFLPDDLKEIGGRQKDYVSFDGGGVGGFLALEGEEVPPGTFICNMILSKKEF